ncbi:unnamed protein product [Adineta ricciae]|uniref:Uncharacterized protein n=1 Tax=Adineta ricciae TaxID=249248 RepID=A0A814K1Q6_ADIRI|nr:unnamed protein product [Adineta ricciae]CAF1673321.1 unnamed protein product [Adineta ricciae]
MDLFAVILITITAVTICGICLFIFVCAFQPRLLRKLHGRASRTYQETDSTVSSEKIEETLSLKSLDLASTSASTHNLERDKKAYLKALEQSLRTGKPIQDPEDDDPINERTTSRLNPLNFLSRFINKHIRRKTTNNDNNSNS